MNAALTITFWGVSILFALTPGADWAYAIASGTRHQALVIPAVTGMLAGHLTATLIVAAGVAALFAESDVAMTVLTLAGAGYLVWLGITAFRHSARPGTEHNTAPDRAGRSLVRGLGVSLLNPKVFLLFLALLPQFTSASQMLPVGVQMAVLGIIHVATCAVVYFAVGYGAAAVLTRRPRAARIVTIASGTVMIGLGVALAGEKLLTGIA